MTKDSQLKVHLFAVPELFRLYQIIFSRWRLPSCHGNVDVRLDTTLKKMSAIIGSFRNMLSMPVHISGGLLCNVNVLLLNSQSLWLKLK